MITMVSSIFSLLFGLGILLIGSGCLGTLLGMRATVEHFSETVTGLIMSAYFLGFVVGAYFCPPIINRVGHIRTFAAMAAVASAVVLVHALVIDPLAWAVLRFVTGVCSVGLFLVIESWLNTQSSNQQRGQVFALYMTVNMVAMAAGQYLILINDITSFVPFAVITMLYSLSLVPVALTRVLEPLPVTTPALRLHHLFGKSPLGVLGTLIAGLVVGAFWGMGAVFAKLMGLSNHWIAAFMSATIMGGAVLQLPIGRLSDRRDRRIVLLIVSLAGAATALTGFAVAWKASLAMVVGSFFYGGFTMPIYALSVAHTNDQLSSSEILDATSGLLLTYGVGAAVGPAAAGVLMSGFGPRALLMYQSVLLLFLVLSTLFFMRVRAPVPAEEQGEFVPMVRTSQAALEMHPEAEVEPELDLE